MVFKRAATARTAIERTSARPLRNKMRDRNPLVDTSMRIQGKILTEDDIADDIEERRHS